MNNTDELIDKLATNENASTPEWFGQIQGPLTLTPFTNIVNSNQTQIYIGNSGLFVDSYLLKSGAEKSNLHFKPNGALLYEYLTHNESLFVTQILGASVMSFLDFYRNKADTLTQSKVKNVRADFDYKYLNTLKIYLDHVNINIYTEDFDEDYSLPVLLISMEKFSNEYENRLKTQSADLSMKMLGNFFTVNEKIMRGRAPIMVNPRLNRFKSPAGELYYDL